MTWRQPSRGTDWFTRRVIASAESVAGDEVFGVVAKAVITDGGGFGEYQTTAAQFGIA